MLYGHGDDIYQYGDIRMNFSSNICGQADMQGLKAHLASRLDLVNNYPEPEAWSLERMIAERHGMEPSQIIVTSGATEAIYLIAQAFPYQVEIPNPTFSEYEDACTMFPRTDTGHRMLWLCNPNNPTGEVWDEDVVRTLAQRHRWLVVDQSYEDYTDQFVMNPRLAALTPYMIQIHSLTKTYGIPGLRLGYITAHASLTEHLRRFLRPWSVNALAVEAGKYLLQHGLRLKPDLREARRLAQMLRSVENVSVYESSTNFMLCEIHPCTAAELKDYLAKEHGMLIRDASNFKGLSPHHFRIAAQSPTENDALVEAIKQKLKLKVES